MKAIIYLFVFIVFISCSSPKSELHAYPIEGVNLNQIELTDQFWLPKIKTIQHKTIAFALEKCEQEGRMENFLIAGGIMEGQVRGVMPFDDTDLYKIIEGAAYSLIMSPDTVLESLVDSLISIIAIGQEADGYLTTYKTIDPTNGPAHWCPAGDRWEDLACSHELYNSGHLFEAATAHYTATGKTNFLDIAVKNADLLVDVFGPGKNPEMPGHQIVETGLIKLYKATQKEEYLALAKHFLDARGDSTIRPLFGPYNQDHLPVVEQDEVVGHAVRGVYMYAGMTDVAALYNDADYLNAVNKLWENMVNKKMYITGGIGALHEGEAFGENYELPNLTAYSETCAAIGSVYWNHRLFLLTGDVKYLDIIERTLYNGVIPGISLEGTEFFYPNALESDGKYDFNKGHCTRSEWFDCSCCPTNLIRFIPSIPNLIYATTANELYVNLYASNSAEIEVGSSLVGITQQSNYPWSGETSIELNPISSSEFTLKLRVPGWMRNETVPGDLYHYTSESTLQSTLLLNGEKVAVEAIDGFYSISRTWEKGDRLEINFPMEVKQVVSNEKVTNNLNHVAIEYGPLVYCAEEADNKNENWAVNTESNFKATYDTSFFDGMNVLKSESELTLIPYFAWSNRGVGKMKVWLPLE
ncbi:MAG: glycoside hydrolase family 127 protein [Prolixibacteraceae bacterium]|nr:glycoside hydrolase family 127 protein [Prolixibacteraceae bacterium]